MANRLATLACTTSIGPGATNMLTAAAGATINRIPVLLLPGDIFATRRVAPVLQQLESAQTQDISVNDAFRPVSRYWDRIYRPEQLVTSLLEAMRVLTSPADTGAVTLAIPQDVQAEAFDFPAELFARRVWHVRRPVPEPEIVRAAAAQIRAAKRPLIVAGGGVLYSEATAALRAFAAATGIPVGETMAGKGALAYDDPLALGAIGATGTPGANIMAREADLVIGVGTRYSDFTTASKTAFQDPGVRFVNVNVSEFDAFKHAALPMIADARVALDALRAALESWQVEPTYRERAAKFNREWDAEVQKHYDRGHAPLPSQGEVIGAVNTFARPQDVVVCAAGSLPGDLHKLWRASKPGTYHLEYGYSTMGYEIAGGLGVKLAAPDDQVFVLVGDGSYLMLSGEIATSVQEDMKLVIVVFENHAFQSIHNLSVASGGRNEFNVFRRRDPATGRYTGTDLPIDFAANARSLGADAIVASDAAGLAEALTKARQSDRTTVIVASIDPSVGVPGYDGWWDVPIAEVSTSEPVRQAREAHAGGVARERRFV
jgi:3D-(3,5/4)-trihydroxycyclohexane-1,2-dione acylhydrolase (decyclizing)